MKFCFVLPFLLLLFDSSKESTLSHKIRIRGLDTTLQANFNGSYQRKNPCTNAEIESSSYVASHEFHHHVNEDTWSDYSHKCSAIINSFLRGIGNLVRFNSKPNGAFNFHINTSISQKQDGHCLSSDKKQCSSLPTIIIEAESCQLPPPCECSSKEEVLSRRRTLKPIDNYSTTQSPTYTPFQDERVYKRVTEQKLKDRKLIPVNDGQDNRNFAGPTTPSAQAEKGGTKFDSQGLFNGFTQDIKPIELPATFTQSSDEFTTVYPDERATAPRDRQNNEYVNPPVTPTQWGDFTEGATRYRNPSQTYERTPRPTFVNDEKLITEPYQPKKPIFEDLGEEIPDVPPFERESSPVDQYQQPIPVDSVKARDPTFTNYDEEIPSSDRFQPADGSPNRVSDPSEKFPLRQEPFDDRCESTTPYPRVSTSPSQSTEFEEYDETVLRPPEEPIPNSPETDLPEISSYPPPINEFEEYDETVTKPPIGGFSPDEEQTAASLKTPPGSSYPDYDPEEFSKPTTPMVEYPDQFSTTPLPFSESSSDIPAGPVIPKRVDSSFTRQPFPQPNSDSSQDYYKPIRDVDSQPFMTSTNRYSDIPQELTTPSSSPISSQTEESEDYRMSPESVSPSSIIPPAEYVPPPPSVFSASQRSHNYEPIQPKLQRDEAPFYEQPDQTSTAPEFSQDYEAPTFPAPQQTDNNLPIQPELQKDEAPFYDQLDQTSTAPEFSDDYQTTPAPESRQNTADFVKGQKHYPEQYPTRPVPTLYSEPFPTDDQTTSDYQDPYFSKTDRQSFTNPPMTDLPTETFPDSLTKYPTERQDSPIRPTPSLTTLSPRDSDMIMPQESNFHPLVYDEPPKFTPNPALESFTTIPPNPESFTMYDSQYPEQPSQDEVAEPNPPTLEESNNIRSNRFTEQTNTNFNPLLVPSSSNSEEYENTKTPLPFPESSSDRPLNPEPMETSYTERVDSAFSRQPFSQSSSDSSQDYYDPDGDLDQQPLRTSTDRNLEETTTMSPPIRPQTEQSDYYKVSQEPDFEVTETPSRSEFYDERSDAPSSTIPPVEYVSAPPSSQIPPPPGFSAPQRFYNIQPKPQDDSSFYERLDQTSAPEFSQDYEAPRFPAPQQPYNNQPKFQKDEAPFYDQLDQTAPEFPDEYLTEPPPKSTQNTVVNAEEQKRYPEQYTRPVPTLYSEPVPTDDQTTPDYQDSFFSKTDRQSFTDSPTTNQKFSDPPVEHPTLRKDSPVRPTPFLTTLPPRASDRVLPQETDFYTPVYDEPRKYPKSTPEPSLESFTTIPPNPEDFAMYDSQYPEQPSQDDGAEPNPAPFDDSSSDFKPLLTPSPTNFERFEPPTTPLPPYSEDSSALTNPPAFAEPISYSESSSQVYDNQNDQQFLKSNERYPEQYSSASPPPSQRETPFFGRETGFQQPPINNMREYQPEMRDTTPSLLTPPPQSFESSEVFESENQKSTEFPDLGNPDEQTKESADQYFAPNSEDYPTDVLPITQPPETQPLSATNKAQAQTFLTYSNADSDSINNRPPTADSLPVWTDRSPVDDSSDFPEASSNTPRQNAFDSSISSKDVKSFSQYPPTTPPPTSDPGVDYPSTMQPTSQTQSPYYYNEEIPDSYAQPQPEELENADYLPTPPTYQDFTPAEEPFMGAVTTPVPQTQENMPNYSPAQPQPQPSYDKFSDIPGDNTPLLASRTFENSKTADQYPVTSFPSTQQTFNRPPGGFLTTPTPFSVTDIPPYASSGVGLESEEIVPDNKRFDENTGARETLLYPDNVSPQPQPTTAVNYDEEMETTQYQTSPAPNPQPQTTLNYANQLSDDNPNGKLPEIFANQQPLPNSDDVYSVAESTPSVSDFEGPTPPSDDFSVENKMTEELYTVPPRDENLQETEEIGTTDYPTEAPDSVGSYLPYTNQLRSQSVYRKSSPPPVENLSRDPVSSRVNSEKGRGPSLTESNKHPESFPFYKEPPQRRQQHPNYRKDWISRNSRPSSPERYFNPDRNMNYNRAPKRQEIPRRFSRPQQVERYYEEGFPQNASYPDYTERRPPFPGHDYSEYDQVFPRERFDYDEVMSQDSQKMDRRPYDRRDEQQRYYQGRRPVNYTPDREFPQQEHSNPLLHTLESQMDMPLHEPNESFLPEPNYQRDSHRWEPNPPPRHQDAIKPIKPESRLDSDPTGPSNNPDGTSNGRFNYMDRRSREPFYEESMRPVSTSERF